MRTPSRKSAPPGEPRRLSEPDVAVHVCREGVLIPFPATYMFLADWRSLANVVVDEAHGLLLPRCRNTDNLLGQPPLSIRLRVSEIAAVEAAEAAGLYAASIFGPEQEKIANEDFALAAALTVRGQRYAFAAVADGVTTRTFWPERSSRLACFAALRTSVGHLESGNGFSNLEVENFRTALSTDLEQVLARDQQLLTASGAIPSDWDAAQFHRHKGRREFWYNSTLIMAAVGPAAGMVVWAGDGGLRIEKRFAGGKVRVSEPLRSTGDPQVSNVVSLGGSIHFTGGRFDVAPELSGVVLTLVTDGVDRTQQQLKEPLALEGEFGSERLAGALQSLCNKPGRELDNYSAAILSWPSKPAEGTRWQASMLSALLALGGFAPGAGEAPMRKVERTTKTEQLSPAEKRRSRSR
jgi:hypothetical protein